MAGYLLDTNIFIQAHRATYPLDVVPSFWAKLKNMSDRGVIKSIDKVKKEIFDKSAHEDELRKWCEANLNETFFNDTSSCLSMYIKIINWAVSKGTHYTPVAIAEFSATDLADPWIIAYAKTNDMIIVTYETSDENIKKRIKIPEPCKHFGVRYITPIEMFRELGETF